jgi:predicted dehydrogenase
MTRLRLAVLGGGANSAVGRAHLSSLNLSNGWTNAIGLFSRDKNINRESALLWQIGHLVDTFEEFVEMSREFADVFLVLTPTPDHFSQLRRLIPLGMPIICEKSVTSSYSQAQEVDKLVKKFNTKVLVTYNYTAYPMVREIREMVKRGDFGDIHTFQIDMLQDGFLTVDNSGNRKNIQEWRAKDYEIPTVSLDLGVHCFNLLHFILDDSIKELIGIQASHGNYKNVIDSVSSIIRTRSGASGQIRFGKAFLGEKNRFTISIYGSSGAAKWNQEWPNEFLLSDKYGEVTIKTFASPNLIEANKSRYMRFKAGHPFGFIEAFANLYDDIHRHINNHDSDFVFGVENALKDLRALTALQTSAKSGSWVMLDNTKGMTVAE